MRIVIAPDKFKGCLPADQVAASLAAGVSRRWPGATVDLCPQADGGEGFVDAMLAATPGRRIVSRVTGPLADLRVDAAWGLLEEGPTAVVEMSAASGLALVPEGLRDPMQTTTHGTGELLLHAARAGARRILLGIGGSATVDAGIGCCNAVGHTVLFRDGEHACPTDPLCGRDLASVYAVKRGRGSPLDRIPIEVACDVSSPLFGPDGAACVFGPQKGATPEQVAWFDQQHRGLAERCLRLDEALIPGSGAAGGLGWAMLSFFDAVLRPGIDLVMSATRLRDRLAGADLCVTGEGSFDGQSLSGKTAVGVARLCREVGVPCALVAGRLAADPSDLFVCAEAVTPAGMALPEAVARAPELIAAAARRLCVG